MGNHQPTTKLKQPKGGVLWVIEEEDAQSVDQAVTGPAAGEPTEEASGFN